jgi:hypothetical protein
VNPVSQVPVGEHGSSEQSAPFGKGVAQTCPQAAICGELHGVAGQVFVTVGVQLTELQLAIATSVPSAATQPAQPASVRFLPRRSANLLASSRNIVCLLFAGVTRLPRNTDVRPRRSDSGKRHAEISTSGCTAVRITCQPPR